MVTAISTTTINSKRSSTPKRPPLLPSESDNAIAPPRKPKSREVTSRYMSSSSSSSSSFSSPPRRCNSPLVTRTVNLNRQKSLSSTPAATPTTVVKRSQSVERRRQGTPRPNGETPVAQKMLYTSARSLSVSFQGESYSIQVSKAKPPPVTQSLRKSTPERRKLNTTTMTPTTVRGRVNGNSDQTENSNSNSILISRSVDQHRWPGKLQQQQANFMNRSLDCGVAARNSNRNGNSVVRSLRNSLLDSRASHEATLRSEGTKNCGSEHEIEPELVLSDNESVTSGSSSGARDNGGGHVQRASRSIVVPARFLQETNRRQSDTPTSRNGGIGNKLTVPPKLLPPKKSVMESPMSSPRGIMNSRLQGSPIRSAVRPASPSKVAAASPWSPSSRGVSPSRGRNGVASSLSSRFVNEPSVLSFAVDVPRGKVGENRIVDGHSLRLLHNRLMQWRFVNARADAALSIQTMNAEKSLYDAWVATSKLRESVIAKRTELQLLKQNFKLMSILKEQMVYLEDWAILDRVYSSSLSGATEALKGSTLRLPVVGGAKIDLQNMKEAICSAMDVMQAMASSICLLLPKVVHVKSLVVEVVNLSAKERFLLDECQDLLSMIRTMQVRESSLMAHSIQMKCLPSSQQ